MRPPTEIAKIGRLGELILESDHPCSEMAKVGRLRETVTLYCYVYF